MTTFEQRFLLKCLSDFCSGRETQAPPEELDVEELFRLANEHSVDSLIFTQCRKWLGLNAGTARFQSVFLWHVFYSVNRAAFLREIAERFRAEGIDLLCMKGAVFRDAYPEPALRTMGDIDLVIRPNDRKAADRILCEDMCLSRQIDNHAVWTYWIEQFEFEIHDHMFYENLANRFDYRSYFDRVWEHVHHEAVFGIEAENLYVPDEEYHFLFLMAHTAKHIINNGSGFRAYLDMVLLARRWTERLDWPWIEKELTEMGLLEFTRTCFALCERWFGVKMPLEQAPLDEDFFATVTEKTFTDGVFGLDNPMNAGAHSAKEIKRAERPYWVSAAGLTMRRLFPAYRDMQLIPWYSFVNGRPWLLPAAWVYRWFYVLRRKKTTGVDLLREPYALRQTIEKRENFIRGWGL